MFINWQITFLRLWFKCSFLITFPGQLLEWTFNICQGACLCKAKHFRARGGFVGCALRKTAPCSKGIHGLFILDIVLFYFFMISRYSLLENRVSLGLKIKILQKEMFNHQQRDLDLVLILCHSLTVAKLSDMVCNLTLRQWQPKHVVSFVSCQSCDQQ